MYSAYITTLKGLRKHSNADRLQCCLVFGNNVIVDLSYKDGQRVIYFPADGQLSEEFCEENNLVRKKDENGNNIGGYLDPNKRNITALKLRGEKSDGLVLPIEVLSKYTDINKLKDGEQITLLNGHEICKKYIPVQNVKCKKKVSSKKIVQKKVVSYPFFEQHSDTAQLAYNENAFRKGDTCYITLKMHGTSARTSTALEVTKKRRKLPFLKDKETRRYKCVSGTRRTVLKDFSGGYYGDDTFRQKYHDFFKEKLPKGVEVFYEIVGYVNEDKTIMGKCDNKKLKDKDFVKKYGEETIFSYGCEPGQSDCYVYRMTMTNEDGVVVELPWEQVQIECEKMGVKCVPTFEKFLFTTWEDLMKRVEKYYEGTDPIGKTHIREGVVVRIDNREKFTAYKHKGFEFKVLSNIIMENTDVNNIDSELLSEM